jgi:predicted NBD/HSP70 family sugar kinase
LQPSTVSAITDQLIAERWVRVGGLNNIPRGRKPAFLHLNGGRAAFLGINIRATETAIAVADLNLRLIAQETMSTAADPGQFAGELCQRVCHSIRSHPRLTFEGIGLALPGRVDLATGRLVFAPNLRWEPADLKTPLEQATGLPVEQDNAANACALAELWSGRHSEKVHNLIAVTVSEGIGVGMIINGQLVRGSTGFAGEFGHVTVQEAGPRCNCGSRGCLETYASNSAAVRYYSELTSTKRRRASDPLDFDSILRLAEKGDACAGRALERMAQFLGVGIAMLVTGLDPDMVVLVGEVTSAWQRVGPIIDAVVKQRSITKLSTRILPTDARLQPRLRGAVALALQKYFFPPRINYGTLQLGKAIVPQRGTLKEP